MLFDPWCECEVDRQGAHVIATLCEKEGVREEIVPILGATIRGHYAGPQTIAEDLKKLGMSKTARLLNEELPRTKRGRSGDLGARLSLPNM